MIFLTTGEKIRSLRKKMEMRQQELESDNITRAFISMIENGKRGLSKDTAKLIAERLNKKAIDRGIELNIDEAYLLRTPAEDAEIYCLQKLDNMPTKDEMEVIINICKKFGLIRVEALSYKFLGDFYYDGRDLTNAYINFILSLDLYKNTDDTENLAYLFNRLGLCKFYQKQFAEANSFFDRALHYSMFYENEREQKISFYNISRCFEELRNYESSLEYIEKYLLAYDDKLSIEEFTEGNIIRANCKYRVGDKESAYSIYERLLTILEDDNLELKSQICNSIGELYRIDGKSEKALEYFNKAEEIREIKDKKSLSSTLLAKANIYVKQCSYQDALVLCNKVLKLSAEYKLNDNILSCYKLIGTIYTNLKDFNSLKNIYIKLLDFLKTTEGYKEEKLMLYSRLALLYLEQNDIEMCKKYLNMAS